MEYQPAPTVGLGRLGHGFCLIFVVLLQLDAAISTVQLKTLGSLLVKPVDLDYMAVKRQSPALTWVRYDCCSCTPDCRQRTAPPANPVNL